MQWNSLGKVVLPENQLLLYVSDESPNEDWQHFANSYDWEVLQYQDLLSSLGAFIMLMPSIVVIDRRSVVGSEALSHIEDVLSTTPQPMLIVIELGVPDCMAQYGSVVRLGAASDVPPVHILTRLQGLTQER